MKNLETMTPSKVVEVVEENKSSLSVAEWACKSISGFTARAVKTNNAEALAKLLDDGICECLVNTMYTHSASSEEVASFGCQALSDLAVSSRELREFVGELGGCECVVFALSMHIGNAEVAESGTSTIISLGKDLSNSFRLAEAGACEVLVQTGNFGFNIRHPRCTEIASNVCSAISSLCEARNQAKLSESGACELVEALLKMHQESQNVVIAASKALCGLSSLTAENREVLGRIGACSLIIQIISHYEPMASVGIIQNCCECVMHLSLSPTNTERLQQAGACETLVRCLDTHLIDKEFGAEICCGAMVNMITYGLSAPSNVIRFRVSNAQQVLQRVHTSLRASHRAREYATHISEVISHSEVPFVSNQGRPHGESRVGTMVGIVLASEPRSGSIPLQAEYRVEIHKSPSHSSSDSLHSGRSPNSSRSTLQGVDSPPQPHNHRDRDATGEDGSNKDAYFDRAADHDPLFLNRTSSVEGGGLDVYEI
jgi:hypothetical protein